MNIMLSGHVRHVNELCNSHIELMPVPDSVVIVSIFFEQSRKVSTFFVVNGSYLSGTSSIFNSGN
jgi:hypothetical protein